MVLPSNESNDSICVVEIDHDNSIPIQMTEQNRPKPKKSLNLGSTVLNSKVLKIKPFQFCWSHLNYSVEESSGALCRKKVNVKNILQDINGCVKSGEILAVLGTSGAGKTTFMNILAGRASSGLTEGSITLDGKRRGKNFKRQTCYVEQDDVFLANLTVTETFVFNALLRLPRRLSISEKKDRAREVITLLGLHDCADTRMGNALKRGVSGGERKRVAIGVELITNPKILFLDEPTSGLDSFTSFHVMQTIQSLAHDGGRAVVLTIHQPRSKIFDLFDKLLLLSRGKTVYYGPAQETTAFFSGCGFTIDYSPADFVLDVTTVDTRTPELREQTLQRNEELIKSFETSKYGPLALKDGIYVCDDEDDAPSDLPLETAFWLLEFSLLFGRAFRNILREKRATVALFGQSVIMALLTGIVFFDLEYDQNGVQNRLGVLFFVVMMQSFGPIQGKVVLFQLERPLFIRERSAGFYRVSSYYCAKALAEFPVTVWSVVVYSCISYFMVNLNPAGGRFFFFILALIVQFFTAESLGCVISAIAPNLEVAQGLAPVVIIVFMLFGGFYINAASIPVWLSWIRYISFFNYAYAALTINEFDGEEFSCDANLSRCQTSGDTILNNLNFLLNNRWANLGILLAIGLVFQTLGYIALLFVNKPKSKFV